MTEVVTKMRVVSEVEFSDDSFAGPALQDQLASEAASEVAHPFRRSAGEVVKEKAFHLPEGNRAKIGHRRGTEVRFSGELLPVDFRQGSGAALVAVFPHFSWHSSGPSRQGPGHDARIKRMHTESLYNS